MRHHPEHITPLVDDAGDRVGRTVDVPTRIERSIGRHVAVKHPAFTLKNPNKVYALIGSFGANQVNFHRADGSGYSFMGEQIRLLDPINPQVAARMLRNFERWKRFDPKRQVMMKSVLEQTAAIRGISNESAEVLGKVLA